MSVCAIPYLFIEFFFIEFCFKLIRGQNSSNNFVVFVLSSWGCQDEVSDVIQIILLPW